jgi:hypothetical protein
VPSSWLEDAASVIRDIERVAEGCSSPYRATCFQQLLSHWLASRPEGGLSRTTSTAGEPKAQVAESSQAIGRHLAAFFESHGLRPDTFEDLIDPQTGKVLVRDLGRTKRSIQQRLAVLLCLGHFANEGEFAVTQAELVEMCRHYGAFDAANFAKTMRTTMQDSISVFVKSGDSWRLTRPGERFLADVIKSVVQPKPQPVQAKLVVEDSPSGESKMN